MLSQLWTIVQISLVGWHSGSLLWPLGIEHHCFYHFSYTTWFLKLMTSHMSFKVFSVVNMTSSSFSGCEMGSLRKFERFQKRSHQGDDYLAIQTDILPQERTLLVYEGRKASWRDMIWQLGHHVKVYVSPSTTVFPNK